MRFLADEMLGTLARRLRLLGYDTEYARDVGDEALLERARETGRILLTRDRALADRARDAAVLVASTDLDQQLEGLRTRLDLAPDPAAFLTRCAACNGVVAPADRAAVADRVPPSVLARHDAFWQCGGCGRAYWRGSHVDRLEAWVRHFRGV